MEIPKASAEHEWLHQLVGEWAFENNCPEGPDGEPITHTGTERVSKLGDLWVVGEMEGKMPGGGDGMFRAIMTIGYDPQEGVFVGTWVGSVMTTLFNYKGELDAARRTLTLNTTGPSFTEPDATSEYRDIIELQDADTRLFHSQIKGEDGQWHEFMTGVSRRVR